MYTKSAGVNLSGSGRRKPLEKQVTPAKYHEWYLLRAFTTCLTPQSEIFYVSTRSEQIANANSSMYEARYWPAETNIAIISLNAALTDDFSPDTKITTCLRMASCLLMST